MAYGLKYRCTHKELSGDNSETTFLIEILEDGFGGSVTEVKGMGDIFRLNYDKIDARNPTENPVQKGRLEFYLAVEDSTDLAILEEFLAADEDQYQMRLKQDGNVRWTGFILTDLLEYSEGDYPFSGKIVAKDLTRLSGIDFPLTDDRVTLITTLADFLDDVGLGLDIYTYTNWITENTTDSDDFLNQIYNERKAFREFGRTGDETPQQITIAECLDKFLRNYGLILRQENNAWRVYQITALSDPTNVDEFVYDSTGTQTATNLNQDLTVSIDRINRYLLPPSTNEINPGIKRAKVKFDHRNRISGILFPEEVEFTDSDSQDFSEPFISDGNQTLQITGLVRALMRTGATDASADISITIERSGLPDYQWNGTDWTGGIITLDLVDMGGDVWQRSFDIITDPTPPDADGVLSIAISSATASNTMPAVAHTTFWRDLVLEINNINSSVSVDYQLTQSAGYSTNFQLGDTWFGDGPNSFAVSALRYGTGDSQVTETDWQFRGVTSGYRKMHENLLKEIVDTQRNPRRNIQAQLWGDYNSTQIVSHDSKYFFFLGGDLTGRNYWNAQILEINIQTGSDTFEEILKYSEGDESGTVPSSGGSTGGGGITQTEADNRYFEESKNLSEGDPATIRSNIGLEIGSDVQAWSSVLDSVAANDGSADLAFNTLDLQAGVNNESLFRLSHPSAPASAGFEVGFKNITGDNSGIGFAVEFSDTLSDFMDVERETGNVRLLDNTLTINGQQLFTKGGEQLLSTDASPTFETINTGHGDNELYPMNQAVRTTDGVQFEEVLVTDGSTLTDIRFAIGGSGAFLAGRDDGTNLFTLRTYTTDGYQFDLNLGGIDVAGRGMFTMSSGAPSTANSILDIRDSTYALQAGADDANSEVWIRNAEPGVTSGATLFLGDSSGRFTHDMFFETLAGSTSYVSGIFGSGTRWDTSGSTFFEIDNMRVRNELRAHIFKKDIVRASNGYLLITDSAQIGENKTLADNTAGQTLDIDAGDGNATFSIGDLVWAKNIRDDGSLVINGLKAEVTAIDTSDPDITVLTLDTTGGNGGEVFDGDTIVRVSGGYLMNDASSQFSPFLDVYDGVDTWSNFQNTDKLKVRLGNKEGITYDGVTLTGYGLFTANATLTESVLVGDVNEVSNYMKFSGSSMEIDVTDFTLDASAGLRITSDGGGVVRAGPSGTTEQAGLTGATSGSGGADAVAFWGGDSFANRTTAPVWIKRGGDFHFGGSTTDYIESISGTLTADFDDISFSSNTFNLSANGLSITTADGIDVGSDYWHNDGTGSLGGGVLSWTSSTVEAAGWNFTSDEIQDPTGNLLIRSGVSTIQINNTTSTAGQVRRVFLGDTFDYGAMNFSGNFGLKITDGVNDTLFELTDANAIVAGFSFNATELQSTNNTGFETSGIYMDSAGERMSLGTAISFDSGTGALGDLDVSGTLTLPSSATGTGFIDGTGIGFAYDQDITFGLASAGTLTTIGHNSSAGDFEVISDVDFIIDSATSVVLECLATTLTVNDTQIEASRGIVLPSYTDATRPSTPPTGMIIFNTDANTVQVGNNANGWKPL